MGFFHKVFKYIKLYLSIKITNLVALPQTPQGTSPLTHIQGAAPDPVLRQEVKSRPSIDVPAFRNSVLRIHSVKVIHCAIPPGYSREHMLISFPDFIPTSAYLKILSFCRKQ